MKPTALLLIALLPVVASAQSAKPPTPKQPPAPAAPQAKTAVLDAEVIMIGCAPEHIACGIYMNRQEMAIKVTKVASGPLKVGDTPIVEVVTCFDGPLLRKQSAGEAFVQLDEAQIRRGSKIHLEVEVDPSAIFATTDKITVTKL